MFEYIQGLHGFAMFMSLFLVLNINFRGVNAMVIQHVSVAGKGAHIFVVVRFGSARFSTSHLRLVHVDNLNDGRRYDIVGMCRTV